MDPYLPYLFLGGIAIALLGWIAWIATAFEESLFWGLGIVAFPPATLAFGWKHPRRSAVPATAVAIGLALVAAPVILNRLIPLDLGPREKLVDGEVHLTLTGWDRDDYSFLPRKPEVVVLQMANADVNDGTLRYLVGLVNLRELDLSGTGVTDEGLEALAGLPHLETIRLRDTAVGDRGFRGSLAGIDTLRQIDLRGTRVGRELAGEWKSARPGRRVLQ